MSLKVKSIWSDGDQASIGDLEQKVNKNTQDIHSLNDKVAKNETLIDELVKIPRFYNGQVLLFDTKNDFETNLKIPLQLQEDVDYKILNTDHYLKIGNNGLTGGSNIITETNLPYKEWSINIDAMYVTGYGNNPQVFGGTNTSVSTMSISTNTDVQKTSGVSGKKYTSKWNYGIKNNQDFLPIYKNVFAVKFLKNIK